VYSSKSGVWPGSLQPDGLVIFAMLSSGVFEFARPINSSMIFGGSPAAGITVGFEMTRAIPKNYMQSRRSAIDFCPSATKNPPLPGGCDTLLSTFIEKSSFESCSSL
jgi:hypothetical protein